MSFHGQTTYVQILFILRHTFISTFSCVIALFNNFPKFETLLIGHPVYSLCSTRIVSTTPSTIVSSSSSSAPQSASISEPLAAPTLARAGDPDFKSKPVLFQSNRFNYKAIRLKIMVLYETCVFPSNLNFDP